MKVEKSNILISGGYQGIGAFLVEYFSNRANKIITVDQNHGIVNKYNSVDNVSGYCCNLTDCESTQSIAKEIIKEHGQIDVLINNAGLIFNRMLVNLLEPKQRMHSFDEWNNVVRSNLDSVFNLSRIVADHMIGDRIKGLIVNISSISASGNAGQTAYSAAKAGISALTMAWCREFSAFGIRVAGLAPGFFNTPSTHNALKKNVIERIIKETPSRRLGEIEEIAHALRFIIENDFFNGKILELDGGMVLSHG